MEDGPVGEIFVKVKLDVDDPSCGRRCGRLILHYLWLGRIRRCPGDLILHYLWLGLLLYSKQAHAGEWTTLASVSISKTRNIEQAHAGEWTTPASVSISLRSPYVTRRVNQMAIDSDILVKIREAVWKSIRITQTTDTQTHRHTSLPLYIRYSIVWTVWVVLFCCVSISIFFLVLRKKRFLPRIVGLNATYLNYQFKCNSILQQMCSTT